MDFPVELLINAIVAGLLLGGFYAAVTAGVSISFGMLDIVNIAHPAFIIVGSYLAYIINIAARRRSDHRQPADAAGVLRARRGRLSGLLPVVREARPGGAARPRVLLRRPVRHRSRADPRVRRRLPLRRGGLHRPHAQVRLHRPSAAHAGAVRDRTGGVRRAATVHLTNIRRAGDFGGVARSICAAIDVGQSGQHQAHRIRNFHCHGGSCRRPSHHHPAGRTLGWARIYRPSSMAPISVPGGSRGRRARRSRTRGRYIRGRPTARPAG